MSAHQQARGRALVAALVLAATVPLAVAVTPGVAAAGTTITPNTLVDELNADGDCSLREAVRAANLDVAVDACPAGSSATPDTIVLGPGVWRITIPGASEQQALTGDLDIRGSLNIEGAGRTSTFLDGNRLERILDVFQGITVNVSDVRIQNGQPGLGRPGGAIVVLEDSLLTMRRVTIRNNRTVDGPDQDARGGAIYSRGNVQLFNSTVDGNWAQGTSGAGGGIWSSGTLLLQATVVSNNIASGQEPTNPGVAGGGVYSAGQLTLTKATITGNTAAGAGGGLAVVGPSAADVSRTTIAGNHADGAGGGVHNTGTLGVVRTTISGNDATEGGGLFTTLDATLSNTTLSANLATSDGGAVWSSGPQTRLLNVTYALNIADSNDDASGDGGGIYVFGGRVSIRNSLADRNRDLSGEAPNCRVALGELFSQGYNHFGGLTGCTLTGPQTGDHIGGSAMIADLADNGGNTLTHALLPGSPGIDTASPSTPGSGGTACLPVDETGRTRPRDGNDDGTSRCDMGAYELP